MEILLIYSMPSYINAISTAVPPFRYHQAEIMEFMIRTLKLNGEESSRLSSLYKATGIESRYSILKDFSLKPDEYSFFPRDECLEPFPTTGERMETYKKHALPLAIRAIQGIGKSEIAKVTHLITVSCTGMYAPGLDIGIVETLKLPLSTCRTGVNFMGCYAAFNALKLADSICRADPDSSVLIVCLELCSLHFQKEKTEKNMLVNSLFGDGCGAVLINSVPGSGLGLEICAFHSDLALDASAGMTWDISDTGFRMALTHEVPEAIRKNIKKLADNLFNKLDLQGSRVRHYAIHPGGRKILEVIEEEMNIGKEENQFAYRVLRDYGNMSSPTILFVINELVRSLSRKNKGDHILCFAFGPGLTLESMLLKAA